MSFSGKAREVVALRSTDDYRCGTPPLYNYSGTVPLEWRAACFLYTCTAMARLSPFMQIGFTISGGERVDLNIPLAPTVFIKSHGAFVRAFLDCKSPKAFFGNAKPVLSYVENYILFDGRPIPFNPLSLPAKTILEACKAIWDYGASVQVDKDFDIAIRTLNETGGTFFQLPFLFMSDTFRQRVVGQLKDPVLKFYWTWFDSLTARDQNDIAKPIVNRLMPLMTDIQLRRILSQKTSFKPTDTLIVDVDNPLLSALVMASWTGVSFIETNMHVGDSTPFLHIDYLDQLSDKLQTKLLNTATLITTRLGAYDAKIIEPHLNLVADDYRVTNLPPERAYVRLAETHCIYLEPHSEEPTDSNPVHFTPPDIDADIATFMKGLSKRKKK